MNVGQVRSRSIKGFTLVELAVVIVIVGVLAAFGVPRFLKSVERSKAAESFAYLSALRSAQERYSAREGTYASDVGQLDIQAPPPKYFSNPGAVTGNTDLQNSWKLQLSRTGSSAGYGAYTVQFTDQGFDTDSSASSIMSYPEINPMAGSTGS